MNVYLCIYVVRTLENAIVKYDHAIVTARHSDMAIAAAWEIGKALHPEHTCSVTSCELMGRAE